MRTINQYALFDKRPIVKKRSNGIKSVINRQRIKRKREKKKFKIKHNKYTDTITDKHILFDDIIRSFFHYTHMCVQSHIHDCATIMRCTPVVINITEYNNQNGFILLLLSDCFGNCISNWKWNQIDWMHELMNFQHLKFVQLMNIKCITLSQLGCIWHDDFFFSSCG